MTKIMMLASVGVLVLVAFAFVGLSSCTAPKLESAAVTDHSDEIDIAEFAQCITDKGAVFYGASWCGHCKNQKAAFGDALEYVNYVECTENADKCKEAGVQAYPTWKFADGSTALGEQEFEALAEKTGCEL